MTLKDLLIVLFVFLNRLMMMMMTGNYRRLHYTSLPVASPQQVGNVSSDVKRGQNLETETRVLRPRPTPRSGLWGQGRGQFLEVEAKVEAKCLRPRPRGHFGTFLAGGGLRRLQR